MYVLFGQASCLVLMYDGIINCLFSLSLFSSFTVYMYICIYDVYNVCELEKCIGFWEKFENLKFGVPSLLL